MGFKRIGSWSPKQLAATPAGKINAVDKLIMRAEGTATATADPAAPAANNKVRNATKVEKYGIKFDSKLELYMYELLKVEGWPFEFKRKYELQPGFRYRGEWVMPITLTVDFFMPAHNIIVDTKGYANDSSPLKYKGLKRQLLEMSGGHSQPRIEMPSSQKRCRELIEKIRTGHFPLPADKPLSIIQREKRNKRIGAVLHRLNGGYGLPEKDIFISLDQLYTYQNFDFDQLIERLNGL